MKNISPTTIPHFHGLSIGDLETLLFELSIISRTYDYTDDEKKLKFLPSTLKDA